MKKFALAAVAAAAMTGGVAQAYTVGTYSNGFVVPNLEKVANGTTSVGLVNRSGRDVPVFWVFHSQDSEHKLDGCFKMTNNEYKSLTWGQGGFGDDSVTDEKGYGVFSVGKAANCSGAGETGIDDSAKVTASAFQVNTSTGDVAFVPIIDGPLTIKKDHPLTALDVDSLIHVGGAADVIPLGQPNQGPIITARYAKAGGMSTRITVWSTGDHSGRHTVNIYDDKQNRTSTNFNLVHAELDHFDPSTMLGTSAFNDGFIEWHAYRAPGGFSRIGIQEALALGAGTAGRTVNDIVPGRTATGVVGSVFVYSVVDGGATFKNATQTILGAHHR